MSGGSRTRAAAQLACAQDVEKAEALKARVEEVAAREGHAVEATVVSSECFAVLSSPAVSA